MIWFRIFKFLKYSILSQHKYGHGIHSPFVFNLVSVVFRNKAAGSIVLTAEQIRKKMLTDQREVNVVDLGSGGKKLNQRNVSEIAATSPVRPKYGKLLAKMAAEFGGNMILELGTSLGISTLYLAASRPDAEIYTIEGSADIADIARKNFEVAGMKNIKLLEGAFEDVLPAVKAMGKIPGLVFIDGDHRKAPLLRYFETITEIADCNTAVIVDDINHSDEMAEAWEILKKHPMVTVSVDVFQMGIIFFRKGITRIDYTIRY
jgi:predicted O-methyltransferase YrrM